MIPRVLIGFVLLLGIAPAAFAQVANDECTGAIVVNLGSSSLSLTTIGATNSGVGSSCAPPMNRDVWHSFTAPIDGFALVQTFIGLGDQYATVFDNCGGPEVACSPPDGQVRVPVIGGQTYYVMTTSTVEWTGLIQVRVDAIPANDDCANAASIPVDGSFQDVRLYAATASASSTGCGPSGAVDVFYEFTVPSDGLYEIRGASSRDVFVELRSSCAGPTLECIDNATRSPNMISAVVDSLVFEAAAGDFFVARFGSADDTSSGSLAVGPWAGTLTNRHVIVQAERLSATNSTRALWNAIVTNGYSEDQIVVVLPSAIPLLPPSSGTPFWVWVQCGTFPDDFNLEVDAPGAAAVVRDWVLAGSNLYLSGADNWTLNDIGVLAEIDGVGDGTATAGDDSHLGMIGADITAGLDNVYGQEQVGNDSTDRIVPADGVLDVADTLGPNSVVIWSDDDSGGADAPYATGVLYRTSPVSPSDPTPGVVISTSTEFGGLFDGVEFQQTAVLGAYLSVLAAGQPRFIRGDVDQSGVLSLNDALVLLATLFSDPAPYPPCIETIDVNADGTGSLGDVVYLLQATFSGGPPPAPPYPDCGPAAIGSNFTLGCDTSNSNCVQ